MKRIQILLLACFLITGAVSYAQDGGKVNVNKEMARVMKTLPADLQLQVLEYAQRKSEAYSRAQAAAQETVQPQQAQALPEPPKPAPAPATVQTPAPAPQPVQIAPAPEQAVANQHNNAQPARPAWMTDAEALPSTSVVWSSQDHHFGKVAEGPTVTHAFTFKNTGNEPLKLTYVKASCGCTTPKWSTDPIPPGGEGFVEVAFSTKGRPGMQNKSVTVAGNFEGNVIQVLRFSCEVTAATPPAGE